jgi:indolepyruvate ferredoxin oxidoreductase beta subunit
MTATRPICVQIAALGGQGGGVLADWLAQAARAAGYPAQATSIPGVAQRTGATTYYFELFPDKQPPAPPIFCLFPGAGDVDLIAAMEPTEAGRALEKGLVTRRTTVITASQRIFSTAEKMDSRDGTIPADPILAALARTGRQLIVLDLDRLAEAAGSQANAVLFGAIAGSRVLPLADEDYRDAIERSGVAVKSNLAGFAAGLQATRGGGAESVADGLRYDPAPDGFEGDVARFSAAVQPLVGHALARLVDYQDAAYARLYLERLGGIAALDTSPDATLTAEVARRLAAWMSFEDVIRVAQLKTRPGRLARIRAEVGLGGEDPFKVIDYLKPGWEEVASLLPAWLGRILPEPGHKGRRAGGGIPLRLDTTSFVGYAILRGLARMKPWRPRSNRYAREQKAIARWLGAVAGAARRDSDLARRAAEVAVWARGYGPVRARGLAMLARLLADWDNCLAADPEGLAARVAATLDAARSDPDGEGRETATSQRQNQGEVS